MWFLFGFITFLSFAAYAGYKRINASWKGIPAQVGGVSYQYRILRNKYRIIGLMVGIEGAPDYDYAFKAETLLDRFFKFIGLSVEHEIGDNVFDKRVYVVSDDEQLHRQISRNKAIVDSLLGIFDSGAQYNCRTKQIRNNSGRLWVRCKTRKGFDEGKIRDLASQLVEHLDRINRALTRSPRVKTSRWRDPFVIKAAVILAISTGLAINGLAHAVRLMLTKVPFTVDASQLMAAATWWGLIFIGALVLVTLLLLGRTARTHLVLIELLLVGSFGAVSTTYAELRDMNMEFDQSSAAVYDVKAVDKRISRGRRSRSYYLYLEDWNKEQVQRKIQVSRSFYNTIAVGDYVSVWQKSGYLDYRWVARMQKNIDHQDNDRSAQRRRGR